MDMLEKSKQLDEEWELKFNKQPENIQKDILWFHYRALKGKTNMDKKMRYGQKIPDSLLDDIREYYENFTAAFKLLGIDPNKYNE